MKIKKEKIKDNFEPFKLVLEFKSEDDMYDFMDILDYSDCGCMDRLLVLRDEILNILDDNKE